MTDFINRTPNPGKIIDENDDIIDLQQLAESGQITVTATMSPSTVTPIGTSTAPKYVNMTPIAGKFINASDEVIDLIEFLTSGDIQVQVSGGGGGGAPTTASYVTQDDETADLPNSLTMAAIPTGFMTNTLGVGITAPRILTGTANEISVTGGDGSANPVFFLPTAVHFPGTIRLPVGASIDVNEITDDGTITSPANQVLVTKNYVDSRSMGVEVILGTSTTMAPNTRYIVNNASLVTMNMPATMNEGDVIEIWGKGVGLYRVMPSMTQQIHVGPVSTTPTTGYVDATQRYDYVRITCLTDNVEFSLIQRGTVDVQ